jgi:hypothetical protein
MLFVVNEGFSDVRLDTARLGYKCYLLLREGFSDVRSDTARLGYKCYLLLRKVSVTSEWTQQGWDINYICC